MPSLPTKLRQTRWDGPEPTASGAGRCSVKTVSETPEYRITSWEEKGWAIFDEMDERVFAGTLTQCQEWLDHRENETRTASLYALIQRLFGKSV